MDVKRTNNREVVRMKMEKAFAYTRYEVQRDTPHDIRLPRKMATIFSK